MSKKQISWRTSRGSHQNIPCGDHRNQSSFSQCQDSCSLDAARLLCIWCCLLAVPATASVNARTSPFHGPSWSALCPTLRRSFYCSDFSPAVSAPSPVSSYSYQLQQISMSSYNGHSMPLPGLLILCLSRVCWLGVPSIKGLKNRDKSFR